MTRNEVWNWPKVDPDATSTPVCFWVRRSRPRHDEAAGAGRGGGRGHYGAGARLPPCANGARVGASAVAADGVACIDIRLDAQQEITRGRSAKRRQTAAPATAYEAKTSNARCR